MQNLEAVLMKLIYIWKCHFILHRLSKVQAYAVSEQSYKSVWQPVVYVSTALILSS